MEKNHPRKKEKEIEDNRRKDGKYIHGAKEFLLLVYKARYLGGSAF